jgi:hypothetical protein
MASFPVPIVDSDKLGLDGLAAIAVTTPENPADEGLPSTFDSKKPHDGSYEKSGERGIRQPEVPYGRG